MAPPAPFLDGPPALFEPKVDLELELPLLVRVLDPLFFFPAGPVDFTFLPRPAKLLPLAPLRPGPLTRPPVQVLDLDRLGRLPGFLNLLSFVDVEGRVGISETLKNVSIIHPWIPQAGSLIRHTSCIEVFHFRVQMIRREILASLRVVKVEITKFL